jgi:deoxyribonuclease-4
MFVGAHVSISGGPEKAVSEALAIGAKSMGIYTGSQRTWYRKPLSNIAISEFKRACQENNFPPHLILPHASYLINLGSTETEILKKAECNLFLKCNAWNSSV